MISSMRPYATTLHIFKSITRQTGGKVRREEFDSWMDEVNRKALEAMKRRAISTLFGSLTDKIS